MENRRGGSDDGERPPERGVLFERPSRELALIEHSCQALTNWTTKAFDT